MPTTSSLRRSRQNLLEELSARSTHDEAKPELDLRAIGRAMARPLAELFNTTAKTILVGTAIEEADGVGRGMVDEFLDAGFRVFFGYNWNDWKAPFNEANFEIAPIREHYVEPGGEKVDLLIIASLTTGLPVILANNIMDFTDRIESERAILSVAHAEKDFENSLAEHMIGVSDNYDVSALRTDLQAEELWESALAIAKLRVDLGLEQSDRLAHTPNIVREIIQARRAPDRIVEPDPPGF